MAWLWQQLCDHVQSWRRSHARHPWKSEWRRAGLLAVLFSAWSVWATHCQSADGPSVCQGTVLFDWSLQTSFNFTGRGEGWGNEVGGDHHLSFLRLLAHRTSMSPLHLSRSLTSRAACSQLRFRAWSCGSSVLLHVVLGGVGVYRIFYLTVQHTRLIKVFNFLASVDCQDGLCFQWNLDFSNLKGKRQLIWKIKWFEKPGVKLQCSTVGGKRLLVRIIGKF